MTKKVRVENADMAAYGVVVQVFDKGVNGGPDTLVKEVGLDYPTSMTGDDVYLTDTRYLVVKERPLPLPQPVSET